MPASASRFDILSAMMYLIYLSFNNRSAVNPDLDLRDLWESFKGWRWRRSHPEEYRKLLEKLAAIEGDFHDLEPNLYTAREGAKQELVVCL